MLTTVTLAYPLPQAGGSGHEHPCWKTPYQDNVKTLEHYGFTVIPSSSGLLAYGERRLRPSARGERAGGLRAAGAGLRRTTGKKVVVSAGATQEPMDPVRYLTNPPPARWVTPWPVPVCCAAGGRAAVLDELHPAGRALWG